MSDSLVDLAASANNVLAEDAPSIDSPPNNVVQLIRGVYNNATEDWEKNAIVRELTGEDEEYLASLDSKGDLTYNDYIGALLTRAVVSIGSQKVDNNPSLVDDLIIGDRDLLFLGVVRSTYGRKREMSLVCGNCNESNDVTIDLEEDFKVKDAEADLTKPVSVLMKDGSTVSFHYPTAGDSRMATKKATTVAEQNTLIISRCYISSMSRDDKEVWARKLSVADRKKIIKALTSAQPGPKMGEVETQCAHCQETLTVVIDWVSLLFG